MTSSGYHTVERVIRTAHESCLLRAERSKFENQLSESQSEDLCRVVEAFPTNQLMDPLKTSRCNNSYARAVTEVPYLIAYLPTLRAKLESHNSSSFSQDSRLADSD